MQNLGRYTLHGLLGEGGSAKVYKAELNGPAGFRKQVALKIVSNELDEEHRNDLINEARLGALLRHPNVVDIYELVEIDEQIFVAMELIEGPTFLELVRSHGPPPPDIALDLCRQITRGLVHAHSLKVDGRCANLIHRDLKLSNILLDPAGLAKISDFGIARAETISANQTAAGLVKGSLGYMSPEQMTGSPLDQRTDIFSLGVVFYQLLTGSRLIHAETPRDYFTRLLDIDDWIREAHIIDPVRALIPGMDELLFQMLRKNREHRIDSAIWIRKELNTLRTAQDSRVGMHHWIEQVFGIQNPSGTQPIIRTSHLNELSTRPSPPDTAALSTGILVSKETQTPHLPIPPDDFIGRKALTESLMTHVRDKTPAICLKGHGGVGKTRLALEIVSKLHAEFIGGSWFCSLEDVTRRKDMLRRMIEGLKLSTQSQDVKTLQQEIATVLAMRGACLVVLDAAEGVPAQLQRALEHWMRAAPGVRWLITSRRLIKVPGSRVIEVGPMSRSDAVELYHNRSDLALPGASREISASKLRRLVEAAERIPYAIELIAAQAAESSPEEMLKELEQSSSSKDQLIEATVGWSWRQLEAWERWTLAQLSVFRGGFFIEQVEEVVDLSAWSDAPWVVHVVGGLLEKSLLTTQSTHVGPRFDLTRMVSGLAESVLTGHRGALRTTVLLETDREWRRDETRVVKKLELDRDRVYARHGQLFGRLGHETYNESLNRHGGLDLWKRHQMERQNLEAAFERSLEAGRSQDACNLLIGLWTLLVHTSSHRQAMAWSDQLLAEAELSKSARTRILCYRANSLRRLGRLDLASKLAKDVMALAREIRSSSILNSTKLTLSGIFRDQGDVESAMKLCRSVLQIAIQHGKGTLEVRARNHLALCYQSLAEETLALREYQQGLERAIEIGDVFHEALILGNLAITYGRIGQIGEAREHYKAASTAEERLGQRGRMAGILSNLGHLEISLGNYDAARDAITRARDVHLSNGRIGKLSQDLLGLGTICMNTGQLEEARDHFDLACTLARQRRSFRDLALFSIFAGHRSLLADQIKLADAQVSDALKYSQRIGWEQGEAVAWSLKGAIALEHGDHPQAHEYLDRATIQLDERHRDDHAQIHVFKGLLALAEGKQAQAEDHLHAGNDLRKSRGMGEKSLIGLELTRLAIALSEGSSDKTAEVFRASGDVTAKLS